MDGGGGCYRTCDNSSNSSLVLFLLALIITTPTWFNYCFIKNKRRGFFCFVVLSSWGSNEQTAHKTSVTSHPCIRSHMGGLMKTNTITGADKWIKISWAETPSSPLSLSLSLFFILKSRCYTEGEFESVQQRFFRLFVRQIRRLNCGTTC